MINATKKWLFLKFSGALLVPLMIWFIINLIAIYDKDLISLINFFNNSNSKLLFSIFIINAYFFSALSISEVFEDYIKNNKIKNVANRLLYVSAVVIPSITIILILRL
tara:strand:- start:146 stop:469 length:324 start_codon:yes stop_codon:yes gene_type:complete